MASEPSDIVYDERVARLVRAAQNLRGLPGASHQRFCAIGVGGACTCGTDEATEFRTALAALTSQAMPERWGVHLSRRQPSGSKSEQWFFEGYPTVPWSGTREQAERQAAKWNEDQSTNYYTAEARMLPTGATTIPMEL